MLNIGASFGWSVPGLKWLSIACLVLIGWCWWREKKGWGWGMIFLGGLLNLVERLATGAVKDYWRIPYTPIYNNINDYLIAGGVLQLLWFYLWKKRQK